MTGLVDALYKRILLAAHPVGSIYQSTEVTSPAELFGGTWEGLQNRFLVGAGDLYAVGAEGGEATHTLIPEETPKINGRLQFRLGVEGLNLVATYPNISQDGCFTYTGNGGASWANQLDGTAPATNNTSLVTFDNGGEDKPHNNMPPYMAVYMWRRTG